MANWIDVRCKKCQTVLDSVWSEDIDKKLEVFIDIDEESCRCLKHAVKSAEISGYREGYDEAKATYNKED